MSHSLRILCFCTSVFLYRSVPVRRARAKTRKVNMEQYFTRITDASRLRNGDLVVIPSESSKKLKKLHVSCATYRKMGLSVGDTVRSQNTVQAVDNLLTSDDGAPRVLFVHHVELPYMSETDALMLSLGGNAVDTSPKVPVIRAAQLSELPFECQAEKSDFIRLFYASTMSDLVVRMLSGKIRDFMFFSSGTRWTSCETTYEDALASAFESRVGGGKCISTMLPCVNYGGLIHDGNMSEDRIRGFMSSPLFNCDLYVSYNDKPKLNVYAPKKFFEEIARRGAVLYRPSREFLTAVAARSLVDSFVKYAQNARAVIASAELFSAYLRDGIKTCKAKIAAAEKLAKDLGKTGSNSKIVNKFKEIKLCQR